MKELKYIKGDVTNPVGNANKIIIHCCNDLFVMGAGVALAIIQKWPNVLKKYKEWGAKDNPQLGDVLFVEVEKNITVGNMIGQRGTGFSNGVPIRYNAIDKCLKTVLEMAKKNNASIHCPKFGAGLAGGDWNKIEEMIKKNLCEQDIEVIVYEYAG